MFKAILVALCLTPFASFAQCPDLTGLYTCSHERIENFKAEMSQSTDENGVTTYESVINDTQKDVFKADGKPKYIGNTRVTSVCNNGTLVVRTVLVSNGRRIHSLTFTPDLLGMIIAVRTIPGKRSAIICIKES